MCPSKGGERTIFLWLYDKDPDNEYSGYFNNIKYYIQNHRLQIINTIVQVKVMVETQFRKKRINLVIEMDSLNIYSVHDSVFSLCK